MTRARDAAALLGLVGPALGPRGGGSRYANLDPFELKGWPELRRWREERRASGWRPSGAPAAVREPDLARLREPPGPQATWIGHATYLLQVDGRTLLTDPVWGAAGYGAVRRKVPPGVRWRDLPPLDAVLVSHNHMDHLDLPTMLRVPRRTPVLCPSGLASWFRFYGFKDVREVAWWDVVRLDGLEVAAVPAQHWSRRGLWDTGRSHWCGWHVAGERRLYFAGDTASFSGFRLLRERLGAPDVAVLPVGAYEPRWFMRTVHLDPDEAVAAYRDLGASRLLPMHWGTFPLTDEPLDEPPARLRAAWERERAPGTLHVPDVGETVGL